MNKQRNLFITIGFVLAISLIASAVSVLLTCYHYGQIQFDLLNTVCGKIVEQEPEIKKIISTALKEYTNGNLINVSGDDLLSTLGYRISDFSAFSFQKNVLFAVIGFITGALIFVFTFLYQNKQNTIRIRALTEYLEQVNTGKAVILSATGEDDFSKLEDEIYKTVTFLYQTKDSAVQAKNDFAENLSNIAHQIKTPITAISLSVQQMKQGLNRQHLEQVEKQLLRLTYLEEALLVLSRIDAGTLQLRRDEVDVFTLLVLAGDNLLELFANSGTSLDIPELGEMMVSVDLEWTMEAIMNLLKNCMEHTEGGVVHCSYTQNPLYTEILIWDDGEGFSKEDIPHLFERFYRGKNASKDGIGIGLALAKEIIERQNGTIRAKNKPYNGALFEIHFYSH